MKIGWLAALCAVAALGAISAGSSLAVAAATEDDFTMQTTRNLVNLCGTSPDDPVHDQAQELCLGFIAGAANMHRLLVAEKKLAGGPIACPTQSVSRADFAAYFVGWANDHSQYTTLPSR
ncbi:MAG TPA: Rap1a/Tai family immunity protein, partial [Stellaceae bacterium]|nr:Rap1a/Tai family immunity protein [Stellaceae bacterium]